MLTNRLRKVDWYKMAFDMAGFIDIAFILICMFFNLWVFFDDQIQDSIILCTLLLLDQFIKLWIPTYYFYLAYFVDEQKGVT